MAHYKVTNPRTKETATVEADDVKTALAQAVAEHPSLAPKKEHWWQRKPRLLAERLISNCRVIDIKTKTIKSVYVDRPEEVAGARRFNFAGRWLYYLIRNEKGVLDAYRRPDDIKVTPHSLWRRVHTKEKWRDLLANPPTTMEKLYPLFTFGIWGVVIIAFVLFFGK